MPEVEGAAAVDGRAGGDLAGLGEAFEEGADPLGGDGVLAADRCIGESGLAIGEDALTQVEGVGHDELRGATGVTRIVTQTATERKRETEIALRPASSRSDPPRYERRANHTAWIWIGTSGGPAGSRSEPVRT
jgi:hypothetical protein